MAYIVAVHAGGGVRSVLLVTRLPSRFSFSQLIESWPVRLDKLLRYVVGRVADIVRFTVLVTFSHIPRTVLRTDLSHSLVNNISIVGTGTPYIGVGLLVCFLLFETFCFLVRFSS